MEGATSTVPRATRERILEAACDLIAADGIDEVRIARVATRAGASTALVHHYFSTREELLEQALIHSFERAGEDRFGEPPERPKRHRGLARAIEDCLPCPAPRSASGCSGSSSGCAPCVTPGFARRRRLYGRYREVDRGAWSAGPRERRVSLRRGPEAGRRPGHGAARRRRDPGHARRPGDGRRGAPGRWSPSGSPPSWGSTRARSARQNRRHGARPVRDGVPPPHLLDIHLLDIAALVSRSGWV